MHSFTTSPERMAKPIPSTRFPGRREKLSPSFPCPATRRSLSPRFGVPVPSALPTFLRIRATARWSHIGECPRAISRCAAISLSRFCRVAERCLVGLFFGHAQPAMFNARAERILMGLAAQAAVAIDNARLYQTSVREVAARKDAEEQLQELNRNLEQRASQRARAACCKRHQAGGKRAAIPNAGRRGHRLRDLHARSNRHRGELESRSAAHQGL